MVRTRTLSLSLYVPVPISQSQPGSRPLNIPAHPEQTPSRSPPFSMTRHARHRHIRACSAAPCQPRAHGGRPPEPCARGAMCCWRRRRESNGHSLWIDMFLGLKTSLRPLTAASSPPRLTRKLTEPSLCIERPRPWAKCWHCATGEGHPPNVL